MNALSWLLYLIYALSTVNVLLLFFAGISTVTIAILIAVSIYTNSEDNGTKESDPVGAAWWISYAKRWVWLPIVLWTVFALVPDDQTVKLIAASEVAEYVINTEAGQKTISEVTNAAGKSGEIVNDSLNLLQVYIKGELNTLLAEQMAAKTEKSDVK